VPRMIMRLGRQWWDKGTDPDDRYSLANERSFPGLDPHVAGVDRGRGRRGAAGVAVP